MCIYTYLYIYIYVNVGRSVGRSSRVGSVDVLPHFAHSTATPLQRHLNPPLPPSIRFKGLINSQGPQALALHPVRRLYQSTWFAGLINSTGPQALSKTQHL